MADDGGGCDCVTDDRDSLTLPPPSGRHIRCHNHSIGEEGGGRIRELGRQWWIRGFGRPWRVCLRGRGPGPCPASTAGALLLHLPPQKKIFGGSRGSIGHFVAVWRRGHFGALCKRRLLGALWKCVLLGRSGNADSWGYPGSAGMV